MKIKNIAIGAFTVIVVMGVSGCSSQMSKQEAAEKYLDAACPANIAVNSGDYDTLTTNLEALKANSAQVRDALQNEAKVFSDSSIAWPTEVKELIPKLADGLLPGITYFNRLALADNWDIVNSISFPSSDSFEEDVQKVRIALDLPASITETCKSR